MECLVGQQFHLSGQSMCHLLIRFLSHIVKSVNTIFILIIDYHVNYIKNYKQYNN